MKAAVQWATEHTRGELLMPSDVVDDGLGTTVMDVLCQKHPSTPGASSLVPCDDLPLFEDVEITGSHLLFVAHRIQGGAGPGDCDAGHWRMYYFSLALIAPDFVMLLLPLLADF